MSFDVKGEKCVVCHAYLFEDDDVVYCPECGAPHHKDCYKTVGHCGVEAFHGTDNQYKRKPPEQENAQNEQGDKSEPSHSAYVKCGMCGESYDFSENMCPECGAPNLAKSGGKFVMFDFLGGVPADMDIGDGVTADEAKRFVSTNSQRYLPKFAAFKNLKKRTSWNWLAFLEPCAWFLSRKMYKAGALVGALQVAFSMLLIPFTNAIYYIDTESVNNYVEMAGVIAENLPSIGMVAVATAFVGGVCNLILRIISGIFGDLIYRNYVVSTIKKIKTESDDINMDFRRKGGLSLIACVIGLYLPSIVMMLF